ncbi:MAG: restriction endonuclease subunit S [Pseudolabrys sp.]|nr:restriction endonuclease subunit S [Pseudolabrys sp.]
MRTVSFQTLIDEGVLQIGDGHRAKLEELGGSGLPFLRSEFVDDRHIAFDDAECFREELTPKLKTKLSRPGDTVITTKGNSTGRAAYVRQESRTFVYSPHLSFWRSLDDGKLHSGFLREWAHSPEFIDQLNGMKDSTDMAPYLSLTDQRRLRITVLEPNEQLAAARLLGTLDDKIELNRQMNRTLEELAAVTFRSWFVDFDPVVAKAAGRAPLGLAPKVAGLFSSTFTDSKLGPIPLGWQVGSIDELCKKIESGGTPARNRPEFWSENEIPWFKTGELFDCPLISSEETISQAGLRDSACKLWKPGTVLFALYASPTLGRLGVLEVDGTANQACAALVPKDNVGIQFVFFTLQNAREDLQRVSAGAAQQNINQKILRSHATLVPPTTITQAFENITAPLYRQRVHNTRESRTLATLRDALLPKLLSGEMRVKDIEKKVAAVV